MDLLAEKLRLIVLIAQSEDEELINQLIEIKEQAEAASNQSQLKSSTKDELRDEES